MTFQPATDCVEVVTDFLVAGAATANRMVYRKAGGYTQADIDTLADNMDDTTSSYYRLIINEADSYIGTRVRGLSVATDLQSAYSAGAGLGAITGEAFPNQTSLCITLRSGVSGRSARGRFYVQRPSISQSADGNTATSAYGIAAVDVVNRLIARAATTGWQAVICSRFSGGVKRASAVLFPITTVQLRNSRFDSQRNRMPPPA